MLLTSIEIALPPSEVRKVFLAFGSLPSYTTGFIRSITPLPPADPASLKAGDTLKVELEGMTIAPVVRENSPQQFKWRGSALGGIFTGDHFFRFEDSQITEGATTFVHGEEFSGALAWLMTEGWVLERRTRRGFEGFNADFRGCCEGRGEGGM